MSDQIPHGDVTIRAVTPDDLPTILALIRELAEYERLTHEVVTTVDSLNECMFGSRPAAEAIIADVAGSSVGYAIFFTSFSSFTGRPGLYLEDIYVQPALRGQGIGKRLLARVAQIGVERGSARLEWAVLDWNEPSMRFYESLLGARAMSEWTVYRMTAESIANLARTEH